MELSDFFREHPAVALAFSGGVDSAYLLYAAVTAGARVGAYYVKTPFQPAFEYADAKAIAEALGVTLRTLELDVLSDRMVISNPPDRCYYCKHRIFSAIRQAAERDGFPIIADGTNASDPEADRPGMQALRELGVYSPLRSCGLTKAEIRRHSAQAGLFTHSKPAYACLATRIPTGTVITKEKLEITEQAETLLRNLGFRDFRIRMEANGGARLQLLREQMELLLQHRELILKELKQNYPTVVLDLEARP